MIIMKRKANFLFFILFVAVKCFSQGANNYPSDADAELVVAELRVINIGNVDYSITQAYSVFYERVGHPSTKIKMFNSESYCDSIPLTFAIKDSTYLMIDTNFYHRTNYNWQFTDITDTNTIIQFSTTKPIVRVGNFSANINNVDKNIGFAYTHPQVIADSIIYVIGSDSLTSIKKTIVGSSNGVTFSHTEVSGLNNTADGTLLIVIFNMMPQVYNGRKYYFQNNSTFIATPILIE